VLSTVRRPSWEALDAFETAERVRLSAIMAALRRQSHPEVPCGSKASCAFEVGASSLREEPYEAYPPTPASCALLLESLRNGGRLQSGFASKVLGGAAEAFLLEPRLRRASAARAVVVGDLHGSVADLCASMDIAGSPRERDNLVVFNGDFVDRGANSTEVLVAVLALKLAFGDAVHVNRGNHEDVELSKVYDFERELYETFDEDVAHSLLASADSCFAAMPVALVLNDRTLVLHGHLPRTLPPLADFAALPLAPSVAAAHFDPSSAADRRRRGDEERALLVALSGTTKTTTTQDDPGVSGVLLLQDVLWSDPDHDDVVSGDFAPNGRRGGAGVVVSDEALRKYLVREDLRRLVRSHEVSVLGAEKVDLGGGKERWTVFSCSRYPHGEGLNKAAVLVFDGEEDHCEPRRWGQVHSLEGEDDETSFHARVRGLLRRHRFPLRVVAKESPDLDAAEACAKALGRTIGGGQSEVDVWRDDLLPAAAALCKKKQLVSAKDVADLAKSLRVEDGLHRDARVLLRHKVRAGQHRKSTRAAFDALDQNHDGMVSYGEFQAFVKANLPDLELHYIDAAWLFLDSDDSGYLDIDEFHRGFLLHHGAPRSQ